MEDLSKTYLYERGEWIELPRDDFLQELLEGRETAEPTPEWYVSLGYYPKPVVFGTWEGAQVEVYKQHSDVDDAEYTFMCEVSLVGNTHRVFTRDTPSLIGLLNEMGPVMQNCHYAKQRGRPKGQR
jgi:hypothetical protein